MRVLFSLTMLSAATLASSLDDMGHRDFLAFIATNGRNYKNVEEMATRRSVFDQAKEVVKNLNATIEGISFKVNHFADMTEEEKNEMSHAGGRMRESVGKHFESANTKDHRRRLTSTDDDDSWMHSINWKEAGKVTEAWWTGWECSSSWAIAGVTAMQSMHAIKNDSAPIKLSVQEALDCSPDSGCGGGWHVWYWKWAAQNGAQKVEGYPYEEKKGECRHQDNHKVITPVYNDAPYLAMDPKAIFAKLKDGPLVTSVYALNDCWRYYDSGIWDSKIMEACPVTWAPYPDGNSYPNVDTQVTIVGYHHGPSAGYGNGDQMEYNKECRWATMAEREQAECQGAGWSMEPNRIGVEYRKCCTYTPMEPLGDPEAQSYWIVQLPWSAEWGDNGLAYLAVEEGQGVSGMNWAVSYVDV